MTVAMGRADTPLPADVDVAVIGGGIMGLGLAYHLALLSGGKGKQPLSVAVIERSYLVSGASGRNGGGVRMQWGDAGNVRLMMDSIELCKDLAQQLGINLWFRQGGYLFLARTEAGERRLERNVQLHGEVGAPTRLLTAAEAQAIVPQLDVAEVRLATFNPEDGVVFPWAFVWGYAAKAVERGVVLRTHTSVVRVEPLAQGFALHLHTGEVVRARRVVNATGAWSGALNHQLGIDLPNRPHRHEILSSEPLKPFLDPLVVDLSSGLYFSQSTRGELVTGISLPDAPDGSDESLTLHSSLRFLTHLSATLTRLMPITAAMKVLRQWVGPYDVSPDGDAIVGPSPGHPDFIQVCGFTGHGFMMAPAVGRLLARWLALGEAHPMLARWSPGRFAAGGVARREDMIIG
ncbi:FAD-binding oxidoreductase [Nannocystis sp. ILAH1]|uniref:NAD(P)/FAD-dependent oxidoreductase n=1 Tax=unclassified Nannocystis TaxID=2627009 RepID=UPI00227121BE|nr:MULTISPECIES: FAD-binding oxidoreductase [unclassified Nannocystis]MCY0993578.1 FAD-binding oxidoreductase [Nannocystis sp. ILAH1]MCY1063695.1 FAD-binding oxidoreductase [Nannocystis sp. RBIL2]